MCAEDQAKFSGPTENEIFIYHQAGDSVVVLYHTNSLPAVRLENVTAQVTFSPDKNTVLGEVR